MTLLRRNNLNKDLNNSVVAIGNFDGIHLGHQKVINLAKKIAKKEKKSLSIITFEPHPKCFFAKRKKNFRITPFRKKFELVKTLNVDFYINLKFDRDFSEVSAKNFIEDYLISKLKVSHVITGFDFIFGKKRVGNTELLNDYASKTNLFKFTCVEEEKLEGRQIISSSEVRKFLKDANLKKVKEILGRDWSIKARVIKGMQRGRKIGFPTANLNLESYCKLCYGVYKVKISIKKNNFNSIYDGIANYGIKPTFNEVDPILEVNIFGFHEEIYGNLIEVSFISFIRGEKKFDNINELKVQIEKDINVCKRS